LRRARALAAAAALALAPLAAAGALGGCSHASTLGGDPPVEVALPARATYEDGIGTLLDVKCAYCHTAGPSDLKPAQSPPDLDLTVYATTLTADGRVIRGADGIGRFLFDGILEHSVSTYTGATDRAMPLDYGTPLTSGEIDGLLAWSNAGSPRDATPLPAGGDAAVGATLFATPAPQGFACVDCHGTTGGGIAGIGPRIREVAVTPAKVKEMWLYRARHATPLDDADALSLRRYVKGLPGLLFDPGAAVASLSLATEPAGASLTAGAAPVTVVAAALDSGGAAVGAFEGLVAFSIDASSTANATLDPASGEVQATAGEARIAVAATSAGTVVLRASAVEPTATASPLALQAGP
jgi:mono/diheme cytochrome c family protein